MGDSFPPTAADYAQAAAHDAKQKAFEAGKKAEGLEARVTHLEVHLRAALVAIDELRAKLT